MRRIEAEVDLAQAGETAKDQAGADQQQHGQPNLHDQQTRTGAQGPGPGRRAPVLLQCVDHVERGGLTGRGQAAQECHRGRHQSGEDGHGQVEGHLVQPRDPFGRKGHDCSGQPLRHHQATQSAGAGEYEGLDDPFGGQRASRRPERLPHGSFAFAQGDPREHQARDVGAGDTQQHGNAAEERPERRPGRTDDVIQKRLEHDALADSVNGSSAFEVPGDRGQLLRGDLNGRAGP